MKRPKLHVLKTPDGWNIPSFSKSLFLAAHRRPLEKANLIEICFADKEQTANIAQFCGSTTCLLASTNWLYEVNNAVD